MFGLQTNKHAWISCNYMGAKSDVYISRADHHIVLELIYVKLDDCNCTIEDNYSQILTKT